MTKAKILEKFYNHPIEHAQRNVLRESIGSKIKIIHTKNGRIKTFKINLDEVENIREKVRKEMQKLFHRNRFKLDEKSFTQKEAHKTLSPDLLLDENTASFKAINKLNNETVHIEKIIRTVTLNLDGYNDAYIHLTDSNEVKIEDRASLNDYEKEYSEEEFALLLSLVNRFRNKRLIFVSSTPQGGGVALMRHALIKLFSLLNADVHWYVLKPNSEVFNITKRKFHNVLQGVAAPRQELKARDIELYNAWIKQNVNFLKEKLRTADIVVIDDPQPSGLIPYLKKSNPKMKIIYRSHIQIEADLTGKKGTPQYKTWQFLWKNIKDADLFVAHPIASFIPKEVPKNKSVFMPAATDPLGNLNKPLSQHRLDYHLNLFDKFLEAENQTPLDRKRPYIIQIARFDPSKGIPHVLRTYLKLSTLLRKKNLQIPQLIITGDGSIDDPDRTLVFDMVTKTINSPTYIHLKNDIKIVRLPHIDQLLNTLLRESRVVLQLSTREGFEIKVTEALMKKKPVVAYKTGGIPFQIKDGVDGFLVDPGDTDHVVKHLFNLLIDKSSYFRMSKAAGDYYDRSLLTVPNAIRWLQQCLRLIDRDKLKSSFANFQRVR